MIIDVIDERLLFGDLARELVPLYMYIQIDINITENSETLNKIFLIDFNKFNIRKSI